MAAKLPKSKSSIVAVAVVLLFAASVAYIWTQQGSNSAIMILVAGVLVFALTWIILTLVSFAQVLTSRRPKKFEQSDQPLTNTQREIGKRRPLILDHDETESEAPQAQTSAEENPPETGGRQPGSRRKN